MSAIHLQRCRTHSHREAAARCPSCRRFFCRECVAEHEGRLLCAECLARVASGIRAPRRSWTWLACPLQWGAALLVAWFCFQALGHVLMQLPDDFHDGTFWRELATPPPNAH